MKSTLLALTWLFSIVLIIVSCQKELSMETNLSTGTLKADSTGNCLLAVVNGVYHTDSLLGATNYIDAEANIFSTGNYSIHSDTLNGFSFYSQGMADSAGIHTVRLYGKGKPLAAGMYTFHLTYGATSCPININVTQGGVAEYTFTNASGPCPDVSFKGTFKANVAMDASTYLEFDVTVTTTGTYAFDVAPVDGISFSGSGVFTATGLQHVVLRGSGTPVSAGSFTVTISSTTANCKNNITVLPADNTPDAVFTLNCTTANVNGTYIRDTAMNALNTVKMYATVTVPGKYTISTPAVNGVVFSTTGAFAAASATPQPITVKANGIPAAKGTFDYPVAGNGSTCTFQVTCMAAPAQAVFDLAGAPNACTSPVISGTYSTGIALTTANTIVIVADVTTPGAYTLATNTVNGMNFSASGAFSNTGLQPVTLTGTGTPAAAGVITFTPQTGLSSCSFNVTVAAATVTAGIFTCKIDGVFTAFNDRANFSHEDVFGAGIVLGLDGYTGPPNGASVTSIQMTIERNDGTAIKAGSYNVDGILPVATGYRIGIIYNEVKPDNTVVSWSTFTNILTNTNPAFTIVITSISATRVKGTFNGKITNQFLGSTQLKTISEGVFDLPVR